MNVSNSTRPSIENQKNELDIFNLHSTNEKINLHNHLEHCLQDSDFFREELFNDFFGKTLDAILFFDESGNIIKANNAATQIFECQMEQLLQKNITEFVFKHEHYLSQIIHVLKAKGKVRDELLFQMPNHQLKYLEFTSTVLSQYGVVVSIFRNVTERYRMERKLRESEERFRNIFSGTDDGMVLWDRNYQIVDMNMQAFSLFECEYKDVIGMDVREFICNHSTARSEFIKHIENSDPEGKVDDDLFTVKLAGKKKSIEVRTKKLSDNLNLTVLRDVSERMEMLEQIRKSDTLNVVGELAAGIAHEIRNPMTALKGFIQLLESSIEGDHSMYFKVITTELQRIESIITEFLILAKPQAVQFRKHDLGNIMFETVELLTAQAMMHNVQFETNCEANLPPIYCEANQLKQVFINIIKNAIEETETGGVVKINVQKEDHTFHISIQDFGEGIPEDRLRKIGEPFYTTKERGTGLGLMVSFKIIKEHFGRIEVDSKVGVGTTFHIYLPIEKELK